MRLSTLAFSFALVACSQSPATSASDAGASADAQLPDAGPCTSPDFRGDPFGIHCNQLVDSLGRTVVLHGINARVPIVFDNAFTDGRLPHEPIPPFGAMDAARIRAIGFNTLRLPINWSGVEPTEDGGVSSSYLDAVASVTQLCGAAGLSVLIDLHQDSYSKEIGEDGAPLWAIQPPPTQLLGGTLPPSTNESAQVVSAFGTFFGTTSEGQYLRDRFTRMASAVAQRFADDPAVVGFELYNEPFTSDVSLQPLYTEMIPSMRAAAPKKLFFWEPDSIRIETGAAAIGDGGALGPGTVYAVHIYNIGSSWETQSELLDTLSTAQTEAQSWGAPLVVTEYGYDPSSPSFATWVGAAEDVESQVGAGDMFWLWKEDSSADWGLYSFDDAGTPTERPDTVKALTRARLEALAGQLVSVVYDSSIPELEVSFLGSQAITAPNVVSVGAEATPPASQWTATCDGVTVPTGGRDPLQILCGGEGAHVLVVSGQ